MNLQGWLSWFIMSVTHLVHFLLWHVVDLTSIVDDEGAMGAKTQIGGDAHNEGNRNKLVLLSWIIIV